VLTVLCGGVGAARLLAGIVDVVDPASVTAIVNVADDVIVHGLHISPDLDTITYTLGGLNNALSGWGVVDESWRVMDELEVLGGPTWFRLGDRDLATHLYRTGRLDAGASLSAITSELAARRRVGIAILPVTDDPVATIVATRAGERLEFQEYFVARRHDVDVVGVEFRGADAARPAPGVLDAIATASKVVIAPSNPILSIDPILAVPGVRAAVDARRADVVAVSPIVAGAALKGPADRLLGDLGHEPSALGVARHYRDLVGTFVLDELDRSLRAEVEALGMHCVVTDTVMAAPSRAAALAKVLVDA
jgi:LPPG:FO 2-phospho-L-lactate transferase